MVPTEQRDPDTPHEAVTSTDPTPTEAIEAVSRAGWAARWAVTVIALALLLAGTFVGQDDDFPFGPFRMYSTTAQLNEPVRSTRLEAVTAEGERIVLTDAAVGLRRAEIEGQLDRFRRDPTLLAAVATAYHRRRPDRPPLVRVEIVVRLLELRDGRPTGQYQDTVEVSHVLRTADR